MLSSNPVLIEVTRGDHVESRHRGAIAVSDAHGNIVNAFGDIDTAIYPRSAIKAFQALPLVESGAAIAFGFGDDEIALACASHNGEPEHIAAAQSMLAKAGFGESALECGPQWPVRAMEQQKLLAAGEPPRPIHNNCSGKHAGMLALARHMGFAPSGYTAHDHPVQRAIADVISQMCGVALDHQPCGVDGCSVPTWAIPLRALAQGFARLATGAEADGPRAGAAARIIAAVGAYPHMVAGTDRFCTRLMTAVPRAFVKTGAEGVFCGCVPHLGIGIALKCDDGAARAAEIMMATTLEALDGWTHSERRALNGFVRSAITNRRDRIVGEIRAIGRS